MPDEKKTQAPDLTTAERKLLEDHRAEQAKRAAKIPKGFERTAARLLELGFEAAFVAGRIELRVVGPINVFAIADRARRELPGANVTGHYDPADGRAWVTVESVDDAALFPEPKPAA